MKYMLSTPESAFDLMQCHSQKIDRIMLLIEAHATPATGLSFESSETILYSTVEQESQAPLLMAAVISFIIIKMSPEMYYHHITSE